MNDWIKPLLSVLPNKLYEETINDVSEDLPRKILQWNIAKLMQVRGLKSAQNLCDAISLQGLSLSKTQINRVIAASSDASGGTLIKISAGLGLSSEDYFYLYSPLGFDSEGKPIAKFFDIDHELLVDCAQDAYTVLSDEDGNIDLPQFMKIAISGYKTISRRKTLK